MIAVRIFSSNSLFQSNACAERYRTMNRRIKGKPDVTKEPESMGRTLTPSDLSHIGPQGESVLWCRPYSLGIVV
jgi:hypothetical protein